MIPTLGNILHGDWKIVTKSARGTMTEYFKGSLVRTDVTPAYATVLDYGRRSQINWRSDLREYAVVEWPPEPPKDPSAPAIVVERSTRDTGEQKQFFGRTARHLITRVNRSDAPESVIDGWYIDAPGLPDRMRGAGNAVAVLTISVAGQKPAMPRIEVKQTGPAPRGFAVWQRITSSAALPGGSAHSFDTLSEVINLVEGTLPDRLFREPDGYRRVTNLPYDAR
jgi:hypothetical protein